MNAIPSLLHPRDRYRTPSAIGAIGRPLPRPILHLALSCTRDSGATVSNPPLKQARNKNAIEAAILNRILDRNSTLNGRGPLSSPTKQRPWWVIRLTFSFSLESFNPGEALRVRGQCGKCGRSFSPLKSKGLRKRGEHGKCRTFGHKNAGSAADWIYCDWL